MRKKHGFTLIELMIVVMILFILTFGVGFGFIGCIVMGNQWYTEDTLLREIKIDHPEAEKVIRTERNIYNYSKVLVENTDSSRTEYDLNTNIMYNYNFTKK